MAVLMLSVLGVAFAICRPFAYRPIEFAPAKLSRKSPTHRPAPGVVTWTAVPKQYELRTATYTLRLWRGTERFPRIYLDGTSVTGEVLRIEGRQIRNTYAPFFYDWAAGDPQVLDLTLRDSGGRIVGQQRLAFQVPTRGVFIEFDSL
jgi:hypothetical protein